MATDTTVSELIINKLTKAQYDAIQNPSDTELYLVPDEEIPNSTIITNDGSGGDSVAIKLTENGSYQRTFRIDMTGVYTGGTVIQRIGSLLMECRYDADIIAHGYYYGDDMSDILTEVAVYQDDQDTNTFYLMLTHKSDLDSVTFAISPTDGGEVDAIITNAADDHTKVDDATITTVGSGGGDGKMGVISQTQTWTQAADGGYDYTIDPASIVRGLIPQANIDLFESAGATFNATSGYFELNGLTDISYEEMQNIYSESHPYRERGNLTTCFINSKSRTNLCIHPSSYVGMLGNTTIESPILGGCGTGSHLEVFSFVLSPESTAYLTYYKINNSLGLFFRNNYYIKKIIGTLVVKDVASFYLSFRGCYNLEDVNLYNLKANIGFNESQRLSKASLLYMINNSQTTAFTITLHASVYAKCQTGGEWYSDISTALRNHPNVSLASA